jgi:hypothetical protein
LEESGDGEDDNSSKETKEEASGNYANNNYVIDYEIGYSDDDSEDEENKFV